MIPLIGPEAGRLLAHRPHRAAPRTGWPGGAATRPAHAGTTSEQDSPAMPQLSWPDSDRRPPYQRGQPQTAEMRVGLRASAQVVGWPGTGPRLSSRGSRLRRDERTLGSLRSWIVMFIDILDGHVLLETECL